MPLLLGQSPDDNKMKSVYLISHVSPTLHKHTLRAHDGKRALRLCRRCCFSNSVPSWFQETAEIERQSDRSCCPQGRAGAVYCYKPPCPVTSVNKTGLSDHRIHFSCSSLSSQCRLINVLVQCFRPAAMHFGQTSLRLKFASLSLEVSAVLCLYLISEQQKGVGRHCRPRLEPVLLT